MDRRGKELSKKFHVASAAAGPIETTGFDGPFRYIGRWLGQGTITAKECAHMTILNNPDVAALLRSWKQLRSRSIKDIVLGALHFTISYPVLVLGPVVILVWAGRAPPAAAMPTTAQLMFRATYFFGIVWIAALALAMVVSGQALYFRRAIRAFEHCILLGLALLTVQAFGSNLVETIRLAISKPEEALAVAASFVVLRIVFAMSPTSRACITEVAERGPVIEPLLTPFPSRRRPRSPEDIHRTAIHEAGHLLMIGARGEPPAQLAVVVHSAIDASDAYRGMVTYNYGSPTSDNLTEGELHWTMLLHLSGTEAEYVVLGDRCDGAVDDNRKWLAAAEVYLSTGFGEVFYVEPATEAQREHNRAVLNDLKAACSQEAMAFLASHRSLLDELSQAIENEKALDFNRLFPFLERVTPLPWLHASKH